MASFVCIAAEAPIVFPIRQNDLYGLIDREGKVIVPVEFTQPLQLRDGLIMASKGTKTAYFDATGKMAIRPEDSFARPFTGPLAAVVIGPQSAWTDAHARMVWRAE